MKNLIKIFVLLFVCFVVSCSIEKPEPDVIKPYEKGVFVVNQGQFGNGTGTITHYDPSTKTATQDLFGKENAGLLLGNIAQSMAVANNLGYIVINNTNTIQVVDANTFKSVDKIEGLGFPRYFLPIDDKKAYITQWGKDGITGSLLRYDYATRKAVEIVQLGKGHERMIKVGNKVYVALSGGYGFDNNILVIDATTDQFISKISVGDCPSALQVDAKGAIWAFCKGYYNPTTQTSTAATLYKIVNDKVEGKPLVLDSYSDFMAINNAKTTLYFQETDGLKKVDVSTGTPVKALFSKGSYYGIAVEPITNNVYCADPIDFKSNGKVDVLGDNGTLINTFAAGIGVSDFWFR